MLHIGLEPEYVMRFAGMLVTNSLLTAVLVSMLIVVLALLVSQYQKGAFGTHVLQRGAEMVIEPLWKFVLNVIGNERVAQAVFPFIATFFIFILFANLVEILPGFLGSFGIWHAAPAEALREGGKETLVPIFRSPSTDLNTTVALALISVGITQVFAIRFLGFNKYISKFINFSSPLKAVLGLFEAISEVSKVLSFSFRLFGNMFAGSVLLLVIGFLVPYILPLPFMVLELFVGLIQALIFSILTLMFIKAALSH